MKCFVKTPKKELITSILLFGLSSFATPFTLLPTRTALAGLKISKVYEEGPKQNSSAFSYALKDTPSPINDGNKREVISSPLIAIAVSSCIFIPVGKAFAIPPIPLVHISAFSGRLENLVTGLSVIAVGVFVLFVSMIFGTTFLETWEFDKDDI